jgi:hypothetical protein
MNIKRKKMENLLGSILINFYAMPREFSAFIRKYISSKHPNLFFYYCFLEIL